MPKAIARLGIVLVCVALAACNTRQPPAVDAPNSIGIATMLPDGTIALWLGFHSDDGLIGHRYEEVPPDDPDYERVKRHIGGIRPGEEKDVPPYLY